MTIPSKTTVTYRVQFTFKKANGESSTWITRQKYKTLAGAQRAIESNHYRHASGEELSGMVITHTATTPVH